MRIILNLAQATAVIDKLEFAGTDFDVGDSIGKDKGIDPKVALKEAMIIIKEAIQGEVQATEVRLESMIIELSEHGYTEVTAELVKVRNEIKTQGQKTEDKYFDENGSIKNKG
tara:strand:+ start:309 stop:647 length:339 start_codon:yes stop_codon:yes gene_type:complete